MGIVIGIAEILLGLYELWTGAKFSRLPLHQKIKGLYWEELRKEVPPKTFVKSAECD